MPRDVDTLLAGILDEIKNSKQLEKKAEDFSKELNSITKMGDPKFRTSDSLLKFAQSLENESVTMDDIKTYIEQFKS